MGDVFVNISVGLLFIAALIWGAWYINKKARRGAGFVRKSRYVKSLDRFPIAKDRWVELVEISGKAYILGVSPNGVTKIDCVDQESLQELEADTQKPFQNVLEQYLKNRQNKK